MTSLLHWIMRANTFLAVAVAISIVLMYAGGVVGGFMFFVYVFMPATALLSLGTVLGAILFLITFFGYGEKIAIWKGILLTIGALLAVMGVLLNLM